jgi:polysaccharide deacetylase 2 family uncharacterized protein YibQ
MSQKHHALYVYILFLCIAVIGASVFFVLHAKTSQHTVSPEYFNHVVISNIAQQAPFVIEPYIDPYVDSYVDAEIPKNVETEISKEKSEITPDYTPEVTETPKQTPLPPIVAVPKGARPKVVLIIDDMGVDHKHSAQVLNLPSSLTLSWLPYAENLKSQIHKAEAKGFETMIHIPMEAMHAKVSLGPDGLYQNMDDAAFQVALEKNIGAFDHYKGANNHMGSRLTQNRALMDKVMNRLKKDSVYFIDSKTTGSSVAGQAAQAAGLPTLSRDVFLDHEASPEFVAKALNETLKIAKRRGYAIAIGHPKPATINGIRTWLQNEGKQVEIVHASQLFE